MPRDGSGIYHRPVGTDAVPDTTVESSKYNNNVADVETDLNVPRPIVAGGTGGSTTTSALTNLGAEFAKQAITNYGSAVFQPGSFFSLTTATAPPVAGHAFVGTVLQQDANNMMLVAQDLTDTVDPGRMWAREMTAGVWGNWTMVSDPYVQNAAPTNPRAGQLWWDTVSGLLYVYFDDGTSKQWVATTPLITPGATLDFPTSPSVGTKFPAGSQAWTWDGAKWITSVGKTPVFIDGSTAMTAQLTLVGDPVNPTDAADKNYVDNSTVSLAGDTMTGLLLLSANPVAALGAAPKQYVDTKIKSVNLQVFTATGTYTPTAGMAFALLETIGGGGGGGGVTTPTTNMGLGGGGGGAGGHSKRLVTAASVGASQAVIVGAGGTGGIGGANGVVGGGTSIGALCISNGGTGGGFASNAQVPSAGIGGAANTGTPTGTGQNGGTGTFSSVATTVSWGGLGGSTAWGGGATGAGAQSSGAAGNSAGANAFGAGGGGGAVNGITGTVNGGNGAGGLAIILEFIAG